MNDKKIIVFTCLRLGDFILSTSAISLVKMFDKNIKLTLIMQDAYISLVEKKLQINNIIKITTKYWNHKNKFIRIGYKIFWSLKNYFKYYKADKFIFLDQFLFLSLILNKFTFIKNIIGPNTFVFGKNIINKDVNYYTDIVKMPFDSDKTHMLMRYQLIIRHTFPTYNLNIPILPNTKYLEDNISCFMKTNKKYKIALCLCGVDKQRSWNLKKFKYVIENLNNTFNLSFFILGSGKDNFIQSKNLINNINKNIDIINCVNKTNLLELKELLSNMDLLISVDTGIVHIASVSNIPIISLHGQTLPEQSMGITYCIEPICCYITCSPCNEKVSKGILCSDPKCMEYITSNIVFEKAKNILNLKETYNV